MDESFDESVGEVDMEQCLADNVNIPDKNTASGVQSDLVNNGIFIKIGRKAVRTHLDAGYNDICDQILVENNKDNLRVLVNSLRSWCERKESEV